MNTKATGNQPITFELGRIVATPGALAECPAFQLLRCLTRHARGDWGCVCDVDRDANNAAVALGIRILSADAIDPAKPSRGHGENTLWIITEGDRSATTCLLPEEY